jgi:hypothetical protein
MKRIEKELSRLGTEGIHGIKIAMVDPQRYKGRYLSGIILGPDSVGATASRAGMWSPRTLAREASAPAAFSFMVFTVFGPVRRCHLRTRAYFQL